MVERNIHHSDDVLKNTMIVRCAKHRVDGSKMGNVLRFFYNKATGKLEDHTHLGPVELEEKRGDDPRAMYKIKPVTPVVPNQAAPKRDGMQPVGTPLPGSTPINPGAPVWPPPPGGVTPQSHNLPLPSPLNEPPKRE